jgi:hypothetical protein
MVNALGAGVVCPEFGTRMNINNLIIALRPH